jgi:hypothetical protein
MEKARYLFECDAEILYMKRLKKISEKTFKSLVSKILCDYNPHEEIYEHRDGVKTFKDLTILVDGVGYIFELKTSKEPGVNRRVGDAINQLISYGLSEKENEKGIILMDIPPAGLLLKYIPAFTQGKFAYKGKMSELNLGLGWVDVLNGIPEICVSFTRRLIPNNLPFKATPFLSSEEFEKEWCDMVTISEDSFYDFIVHRMYLQGRADWEDFGLTQTMINIIQNVARERGYKVDKKIDENW